MNTKHTPGPWALDRYDSCRIFPQHVDPAANANEAALHKRQIAAVLGAGTDAETNSNARLIAAGPELLDAVKALLAATDHKLPASWRRDRPVSFAKAVIAKAEGV